MCKCPTGYSGFRCQEVKEQKCSTYCKNGGEQIMYNGHLEIVGQVFVGLEG